MSETYVKSSLSRHSNLGTLALGSALTAAAFTLLPFLVTGPTLWNPPPIEPIQPAIEKTPETPIEKPDTIEIEETKIEKPELEFPPHQITLEIMESLLTPGSNGAGIRVDLGTTFAPDTEREARVFLSGQLDQKPRVLVAVKPLYPYDMQRSKTAGNVSLEFIIEPSGQVTRPKVVRSSDSAFERPAIEAILKSKWQPGVKDGERVRSLARLTVQFQP